MDHDFESVARRWWSRILLALLCLLTLATSASAECAWVLWEKQENVQWSEGRSAATFWELHAARQSEAECEAVLSRVFNAQVDFWKNLLKNGNGKLSSAPGYYSVSYEKASYGHNFYCLPDTVDPRGPKK